MTGRPRGISDGSVRRDLFEICVFVFKLFGNFTISVRLITVETIDHRNIVRAPSKVHSTRVERAFNTTQCGFLIRIIPENPFGNCKKRQFAYRSIISYSGARFQISLKGANVCGTPIINFFHWVASLMIPRKPGPIP